MNLYHVEGLYDDMQAGFEVWELLSSHDTREQANAKAEYALHAGWETVRIVTCATNPLRDGWRPIEIKRITRAA